MTPVTIATFALGPIGSAAIGFITIPLLAAYFPMDVIGRGALLQVGITFCLLLFGLGLDQAYIRDYFESQNKAGLFKTAILPGLLLLLLLLTLVILIWPTAISDILFGQSELTFSLMTGVCFLGAFLIRFLSLILQLQRRGLSFSSIQILPKFIFLIVLGVYAFTAEHAGLHELLIAHAIAFGGAAMICAWITRRSWWVRSEPVSYLQFSQQLHFGLPLIISGLAYWAVTSLDKLMLRDYASFNELGLYAVASSFAGIAIAVMGIFQTVWTPTAYMWHINGVSAALIHRKIDYVLVVVIGFVVLAGIFSWCVALILPEEYQSSQFIIPSCLVGPLFFILGEASGVGLGISRKSYLVVVAMIVAFAVSALTNYLLVPLYGAAGAASATSIAFLVQLLLRTELANRHWEPVPRRRLYGFSVAITAMGVAYALWGAYQTLFFIGLWVLLLLVTCISFSAELFGLVAWLHRRS